MRRRRSDRDRAGHDRWLVSYADFITLLFSFFVVMYAFAKADHKQQVQVSRAIDTGFQSLGVLPAMSVGGSGAAGEQEAVVPVNTVLGEVALAPAEVKDDLSRMQRELTRMLSSQVAAQAISIQMSREGLVITLREAGFFASGSATVRPEALPVLRRIAATLAETAYQVRVEGHTDNAPMQSALFPSNWELSTARAVRVTRLILATGAIPPERISAAGYAEFHPVASNDTAEGRALNRRVDLVVTPRSRLDFRSQGGSGHGGAWRRITDSDPPAASQ